MRPMDLFTEAIELAKKADQPVRVAMPELVGPEGFFAMAFYNVFPDGSIKSHGVGNPLSPSQFAKAEQHILSLSILEKLGESFVTAAPKE